MTDVLIRGLSEIAIERFDAEACSLGCRATSSCDAGLKGTL